MVDVAATVLVGLAAVLVVVAVPALACWLADRGPVWVEWAVYGLAVLVLLWAVGECVQELIPR